MDERLQAIKNYTEKLGLTFTMADCQGLLHHMAEFEIADIKTGVWDYLDAYEGISHTRDQEFWVGEEVD